MHTRVPSKIPQRAEGKLAPPPHDLGVRVLNPAKQAVNLSRNHLA